MQLLFQTSEIDPGYIRGGEGTAFQQFIFEVMKQDLPHLHPYPAGGKDGGIDHVTDEAGKPRIVIECKFCGTDGIEEVRKRWRVTKGNLEENLAPAAGPKQAQYRPWYRTDEPIVRYIFATSARLENAARVDELRDEIRDFFHGLAATHRHLSHLGGIIVEVHDWNYIQGRIPAFLRFRWFPKERPTGLRLLATEDEAATGFRAWLRNSTLPFYSRAGHLAVDPAPIGSDLPDEKALLGILNKDAGTLGLVLVGSGGVGKTRLALEIGHVAAADGWIVWVVRRHIRPETIDQLAARMDAGTRVLLIFDYIETHSEFTTVVQHLADVVDATDHKLRYVSTCRSSYYNTIKGADRQRVVALSSTKPAAEQWLTRYRHATVEHILDNAGIPANARNTRACHNLPVLAAFLHWLHHRGRADELETLLGEEDFGRWVIQRVHLSFPGRKLDHSLARLIALFPIPATGRDALTDDERELFYCLEQDGWIERADDPTAGAVAWQAAHDVLADRVALEWLQSVGAAAFEWCAELLREAIRFHALPSALRSLQRLQEHLSISDSEWETILIGEIKKNPDEWLPLRASVLRTSLLTAPGRVRLLASVPDAFGGAETDSDFQNALGTLLRQLVDGGLGASLGELDRDTLFAWVRRSIPHQRSLQFLRAWAVRLAPEEFQAETQTFIEVKANQLPTQYIFCAWLYAGLKPERIESAVRSWCSVHANSMFFSFVVEAWLSEGGDPRTIAPFLARWFALFSFTQQASFVLSAWLKHANAPGVVEANVTQWLAEHGKSLEAGYVLSRWLEHASAPGIVEASVTQWLAEHGKSFGATFVLRAWLEHANAPGIVEANVTQWLAEHGKSLEAGYVLSRWLEHANAPKVVEASVTQWLAEHGKSFDATFVLRAWLEYANAPKVVEASVTQWLAEHGKSFDATFVLRAWLEYANAPKVVEASVTQWLAEHGKSFDATFILQTWLKYARAPKVVEASVTQWLAEHRKSLEAGFVLGAWLEYAHAPRVVEANVTQWLAEHGKSLEAGFVLGAWLEYAHAPRVVEANVTQWLAEHGKSLEAGYVLSRWLEHANAPKVVEASVTQWLAEHGKSLEAGYVLSRWLDFGGDLHAIEPYILNWLPVHAQTFEDGSYVLRTWLRSGAASQLAEAFVIAWLTEHGEELDAQFVLAAWLKAKNPPEPLTAFVRAWMEKHGTSKESSHVIGPWLDSKGSFAAVRSAIAMWLMEHGTTYDAWHVLAACLRVDGGRSEVKHAAIQWCEMYAGKFQAFYILEAWLKNCKEPRRIDSFVDQWLAAHGLDYQASRIICAWIAAHGGLNRVRAAVVSWLNARSPFENTSFVLFAWLNEGGDPTHIEPYVTRFLSSSRNSKTAYGLRAAWSKATRRRR